ncbi:uncharacterized protein EV420DRAFT_313306 [Desarmillaria tabescens]|uniref:WW domain-containing protein n=1 Tax=Armillaria tabescens TaxID=1929756 RepID=A0AA39KI04_ARMTA|nr:uncharacterized protein EV420DRAFT_313306 [Desarmillaria tabescens]KAK0459283.1 hypothetical protein EV420DRAFT_313306 [Desarmillaria tabescens]
MFNIQRLLKIFRDLAGGRSPLKVILVLWAFIQRQLRRYLWDRGNQASPKGPQPINDKVFGGPTDEICTKWRMTVMDDDVEEPVSAVVCRSAFPSQSTHGSRSSSRYPSAASSRYGSRSSSRYGSRSSSVTRSTSDHGFSTLPKVRPRSSSQPDFGPYANASGHRLAHYPLPSRSQSRSRSQSVTQPQASFDDPSHMTGSTTKSSEWLSDTLYNSSGPSLPFSTMPDSPSSSDACQSKDPSDLWRESEIIQAMETIESELPSEIDNPYDVQVPNMLAPAPQPTNDSNNTSNFTLTLNAHSSFLPLTPERVPRYNKDFTDESIHTDYLIDPLTISFQQNHVHVDWLMCVHPEGARYFFHQERKVYTDVDISESNNLQLITKFLNDLDNYMNTNGIVISDADLVLDLISDPTGNGGISCAYYFASHENRSIFWFHEFSGTFLSAWNAVKGVTDPGHISLEIEAQYWYHCQLFPTCRQMTLDIIDELRDTLIFWMGDTMTRSKSNSAYNIPELQQMLNLTNTVRKSLDWTSNSRPSLACSIDRLMFIVFRERFINFYGQASARLERDASVYDITFKRTPLVVLLSPLLFFAPDIHLTALKKIKGDGFFRIAAWSGFTEKLYNEWREVILHATVLLTADVAFLAIQSVDDHSTDEGRSPALISVYVSIIASIGSIISGFRMRAHDSSKDAMRFFGKERGLETLAIMYSLPHALLIWAMVAFLVAFSFLCFAASSLSVRILLGIVWILTGVLILWCVITFWDVERLYDRYTWKPQSPIKVWRQFLSAHYMNIMGRMKRRPPMSSMDEAAIRV